MSKSVSEIHTEVCDSIKETYRKKNADYGDAFSKARKEIPHYTLGKLHDKFSRYRTISLGAERLVEDETIEDTLIDMANYCIMEVAELRHDKLADDNVDRCCCNCKSEFSREIFTNTTYLKRHGSMRNYGFKISVLISDDNKSYRLVSYIDEDCYDDNKFVLEGLKHASTELFKYIKDNNLEQDNYNIPWDIDFNIYDIIGDSVFDVYKKLMMSLDFLTAQYYLLDKKNQ